MNEFIRAYKKYVDFKSRDTRKQYWMFYLITLLLSIGLGIVDGVVGANGILAIGFALVSIIPSIAAGARRLHDTNKTGWWQLLYFIPLLGAMIVMIMLVLKTNDEDNRYGSND